MELSNLLPWLAWEPSAYSCSEKDGARRYCGIVLVFRTQSVPARARRRNTRVQHVLQSWVMSPLRDGDPRMQLGSERPRLEGNQASRTRKLAHEVILRY